MSHQNSESLRAMDPNDDPPPPPVSAPASQADYDRIRQAILDGARGTIAEATVADNITKLKVVNSKNSFYDGNLNVFSGTSYALPDFLHEYAHSQTDKEFKKQVADVLAANVGRAQKEENLKAIWVENEVVATAYEIVMLAQIPTSGSTGNALSTLGVNSGYVSTTTAIAIWKEVIAELGLSATGVGQNSSATWQKLLLKVRTRIDKTAVYNSMADWLKQSLPSGTDGSSGVTPPEPPPAPQPIWVPAPPAPHPVTATPGPITPHPPSSPTPPPPPADGDDDPNPDGGEESPPNYPGGGGGGCVAISSYLANGTTAGQVQVGDVLVLAHEQTLEPATGEVSFSQKKTQPGFRLITQSGISLLCSSTAPIPTPDGLVLAPNLLGKKVPTRRDQADGGFATQWETVEAVIDVGPIEVQHITVGDRCFWAGEAKGMYILHHNVKAVPSPGPGDDPDPYEGWDFRHSGDTAARVAMTPPPGPRSLSEVERMSLLLNDAMASFGHSVGTAGQVSSPSSTNSANLLLPPQ